VPEKQTAGVKGRASSRLIGRGIARRSKGPLSIEVWECFNSECYVGKKTEKVCVPVEKGVMQKGIKAGQKKKERPVRKCSCGWPMKLIQVIPVPPGEKITVVIEDGCVRVQKRPSKNLRK